MIETAVVRYTQDDLLNCQLFIASKSKNVKRNRRKTWLILLGCSLVCSVIFYTNDNSFFFYYCVIISILVLLFYPLYQKSLYKRHFKKFVKERFESIRDVEYSIELNEDNIIADSRIGKVIINSSEISEITETKDYFFIKISSGDTLTLPKRYFSGDSLSQAISRISQKHKLSVNNELNWEWK